MKKIIFVITSIMCSSAYAATSAGMLFNVTSSGSSLSISTVAPHHTYPSAGIKINTAGYTLSGAGSECTPIANGYCLFPVSDTQPKTISISGGGSGSLGVTLCLNGNGPLSCQTVNFPSDLPPRAAYVTNYSPSPSISMCPLDSNGIFTTCQGAGGNSDSVIGPNGPQGIVFNNAGTMAYITGYTDTPNLFQCSVNSDGTFNTCSEIVITAPPGYNPEYGMLAINPANTMLYVGDSGASGRILACPLVGGNISPTCTDTGATGFTTGIAGITLNKAGTTAYLADYSSVTVTICAVNGATFSGCVTKTGSSVYSFAQPGDTALNKTETILYVADNTNSAVYGCSTAPNGTSLFDSCFIAASITNAWGITLNKAGTVAYVTDYNASTYQCPVLNDGTFGTCIDISTFNSPVDVALL